MATKKPPSDTIDVSIFDATYTLRGGPDPSAVRALADDLDTRMKALASMAPGADPLKVAILCALRLSDEAREAREAFESLEGSLSGRLDACLSRIDGLLTYENPPVEGAQTGEGHGETVNGGRGQVDDGRLHDRGRAREESAGGPHA